MQINPKLTEISDCLYRISVKAIIVKDGKVLLVKEQDDEWWSFPGGGVDYGESAGQALGRELPEELGIRSDEIQTDDQVIYVVIGAVVDGIPKANLFYRVDVPADKIKATDHVIESGWFEPSELEKLYTSPSIGEKSQLIAVVKDQILHTHS